MSRYPYIDRNPCVVAAGKPIGDPCENVKSLLQNVTLEDKVDALRRQLGLVEAKDFCQDWVKAPDLDTSGAFTEIRHCLRKPMPTQFQAINEELKNTIYDSYWNKPLGKTRDPTPGLPYGMKPEKITFGIRTKMGDPASLVVNPRKPSEYLEKEDRYFHDLYAFTHHNYYPGERINRDYEPPFSEYSSHGLRSGKDESGLRVKRCLTWFNNDPLSKVSRIMATVRDRILPVLGKTTDKTGVTDILPANYAYGTPTPANIYGVEDLLNECPPSSVRRDMLIFLAYANRLRQNVWKKISKGELALEELFEEISSLNQLENKAPDEIYVHFDCIDRIMRRHGIVLDRTKLEPLLLMLGPLQSDFQIKVRDFIRFIDKNSEFPKLKKEYYILPKEFANYKAPFSESDCPKDDYKVLSMPPAGISSYRWDLPRPCFEGCSVNIEHLSQETTARTLISPSIYTQYGLSHRDFFKPRSKEFLGNLFKKIGVTLSDEELNEIYEKGLSLDETGGVCVETFRNILDERAYKAYMRL